MGIERDQALRLVLNDHVLKGILVAAPTDNDAWAAATRGDALTSILHR